MAEPTRRAKETLELISRFQTKRARRRKMYVTAACVGGAFLLALVAALIVLALPRSDSGPVSGLPTTSSFAPDSSTTSSEGTTTTTGSGTTLGVTTTLAGTVAVSSTTTSAVPSTASPTTTPTTAQATGFIVVIDPGHQAKADSDREPVGPGSSTTKAKVSSGTRSVNTGSPESELVLTIGLKLRDALVAQGIQVIMTRTTQDVDISNSQRAQIANAAGADLFVRIHADGVSDSSVHGIHVLYPVSIAGWTDDIAVESKRAAALALEELIAATGAKNKGLNARDDMTGFNWSDVPVFLPEIGYMTNRAEDALLATPEYQAKIVQALTRAVLRYLGVS